MKRIDSGLASNCVPGLSVVLAVDLGGSSMKGAVVTEHGHAVIQEQQPTPAFGIVDELIKLLIQLEDRAVGQGLTVIAAAVVTPGIVDEACGIIRYASNLDWREVPLRALLDKRFGFPIAIGHDVRAAGLAEQLLGAAHGSDEFVLVPIGTGVAATMVTRGETSRGFTGATGEFGHIPVVPDGEVCPCGQRGCLENYASGGGLARRYAAFGGMPSSAREIVDRLGTDPLADQVWADAVRVLAQGLTIMTLLMDPEVIVIGGGFAQAGDALLRPLRASLANGLAWREAPDVLLSTVGVDAGRIGAAILAFKAAGLSAVVEEWPALRP